MPHADLHEPDVDAHAATSIDRREALAKLALGGLGAGLVWAAPAITTVGSAAAAASVTVCTPQVMDWDTRAVGSSFSSAAVAGTTVSVSSTFTDTSARSTNFTIVAGPQGNVNQRALRFEQNPVNGGYQTITVAFSASVSAVSLTIFDIDTSTDSGWSDRIIVDTVPFTYAVPTALPGNPGSTVTGLGTVASPFRNSQTNTNYDNSSRGGNITLSWAGPLTSITFRFACATPESGTNQLINISDINFCR